MTIGIVANVLFLSGCAEDKSVERELLQNCQNHYRATSYKAAMTNCERAAEKGIALAQYLLANIYQYDLAEAGANAELAFKWYTRAAEGGLQEAQTYVGRAYMYGQGVKKDYQEADKWFFKAANNGDVEAQFSLGIMNMEGYGKTLDISAAIAWFRKAAANHHPMSINNLSWIYATSNNQSFRDVKKATYWGEKLSLDLVEEPIDKAVFLDTKAAVSALSGDFDKAIELQSEAIASLPEDFEEERLLEYQNHLESYQQQKPWIEQN